MSSCMAVREGYEPSFVVDIITLYLQISPSLLITEIFVQLALWFTNSLAGSPSPSSCKAQSLKILCMY